MNDGRAGPLTPSSEDRLDGTCASGTTAPATEVTISRIDAMTSGTGVVGSAHTVPGTAPTTCTTVVTAVRTGATAAVIGTVVFCGATTSAIAVARLGSIAGTFGAAVTPAVSEMFAAELNAIDSDCSAD